MAKERQKIIRTRIGEREITEEGIIYFSRGLIGFDDKRDFALIQLSEDSPFLLLQSLEDPGLGLLVADPYSFMDDYEVRLNEAEKRILRVENVRQVAVLVTVTIPPGRPNETTLNLGGPIVINSEARRGMQIPQVDSKYPTHFRPAND
ncbi:flagellar assembly protein FliW [Desulfovibrio sp. JC022]|uniref:flagellar assembly protein FliW n=1 Tax=Desulfovibrio sp. JC022 TaxID=2593642 RepID=UPI0013D772B3|nr:flagellar assembly protein FliW [Desulfovibrio sp. JC022]NDV21464.1 flagellar assembly protein FliW [Desulfovibrio sp. JC022]